MKVRYSTNEYLETMFKLLYLNFTDLRVNQTHVDIFKEERISQYNIDKEKIDISIQKGQYKVLIP